MEMVVMDGEQVEEESGAGIGMVIRVMVGAIRDENGGGGDGEETMH